MKLLDERGIGTVWSICKEKFALAGHTHNYAGSGSPGGSANSAIGVVDYGQTGKTIQIGYSGAGIAGDQIKYIAGYTDGSGNVNAKIKDVSKDALRAWLGLGSLAYSSSSIPTNLSQLNNDKGFVTGSVSGNTVTINGSSTTWTNTWRGIQDNLTSTSTSESLSANQGRILKGLVDGKANSSHTHNYLPLSGGTLTGDLLFSNSGTTFRKIIGTCGDNDFWRIGGGATGSNSGYMEIATADDGTEPIYVRQYSGTFSDITRTATLLDGSGNTSFPGTVAAAKFKGALEGNASTASNASTVNGHTVNANVPSNAKFTDTNTWRPIQDNLTSSSTSDSLSANQGRILKSLVDGKANSSHTHSWSQISVVPIASTQQSGIMSSTDKAKLDGIASGANNYSLPVASSSTLGGIKVSGNANGSSWPICVDSNGLAEAKIQGLIKGDGVLSGVMLGNETRSTYYNYNVINIEDKAAKKRADISFPLKSGTFALTSDLYGVCNFNFINSASECQNGKMNFLYRNNNDDINLNYLDNLQDGLILFIVSSIYGREVSHTSSEWFYNNDRQQGNEHYTVTLRTGQVYLATKYNGQIHLFSLFKE